MTTRKKWYYTLGGISVCGVMCVTYGMYSAFFINICAFSCDPLFSASLQKKMSTWVEAYCAEHEGTGSLVYALQGTFEGIDSVTQSCRASGLHVNVRAQIPLIQFGDVLVLTNQANIIPSSHFSKQALKHLPLITGNYDKMGAIPRYIAKCLIKIQPELFERFKVSWHDQTTIWLRSVDQSHVVICADYASLHNLEKINQCLPLTTQQALGKRSKKTLVTDIRFDNHIIMYEMRGKNNEIIC